MRFVFAVESGRMVSAVVASGGVDRDVVWHRSSVARCERASAGATVWLTGLSGAGKSTVASELERRLIADGRPCYVLDGDNLRHTLNADLGFDRASRDENVRRVGAVAQLFADAGLIAIVPVIAPYAAGRDAVRRAHQALTLPFVEVHMATPLEVCEARDPKGLYRRARAGELIGMTGIDDPYEAPTSPELRLDGNDSVGEAVALIIEALRHTVEAA